MFNKKRFVFLFLTCILCLPSLASAKGLDLTFGPYTTLYGDTGKKDIFSDGEVPSIYFQFDPAAFDSSKNLQFKFVWKDDDKTKYGPEIIKLKNFTGTEYWHTPSNWDAIKKEGDWKVKVQFGNPGLGNKTHVDFTFAPEPVSSILFLLGGTFFAISRRFKKRLTESL